MLVVMSLIAAEGCCYYVTMTACFVHSVDQVESPYSPPDSDGTPLGSPNEQRILSSTVDCSLVLPDIEGKGQTPNNHLEQTEYRTRHSSTSPVRLV